MKRITAASTLLLAACIAGAQTTTDALQQTLQAAQRRDQLEMEGGTPFHLRASFEMFSVDGKSSQKGKLDELWQDNRHWRQEIDLPDRTLVEIDSDGGEWRTGSWVFEYPVWVGFDAMLRPFSYPPPTTSRMELTKERLALLNPSLECIGTEPDLPNVAPEVKLAQTTYCLVPGNHLLHAIERPDWVLAFNDVQPFGKKFIARSVDLSSRGKLYGHFHIDELSTISDFKVLDTPAPDTAQRVPFHRKDMSAGETTEIMRGQPLAQIPWRAPNGHQGEVKFQFHVDSTGAVDSVSIISSEDKFIANSLTLAVKQWRFRVSYQNDHVVGVEY